MTDLLERCAQLVDIPSVSHHEQDLADHVEAELGTVPWLEVTRVGTNVVARTRLGRARRLVLAGHLDTVPPNENDRARIEGDVLWGLGAADMKAGLTVALELARTVAEPAIDVTYVFYECEEVAQTDNGLLKLFGERPDLLECDAAILGEPTGAVVEAGCQGTLRARVVLKGARAHTARAWMGVNAIHRLGGLLSRLTDYVPRRPVLGGCEFREAIQAVSVTAGVAGNVVPDRAEVVINHRFAPDRAGEEALAHVREVFGDAIDETAGDEVDLFDLSEPAPPALDHPLLQSLVDATGAPPRAKLGWTDVSFFAARGVPATNFGPGEPTVAHTREERVDRAQIERVHSVLHDLLTRT